MPLGGSLGTSILKLKSLGHGQEQGLEPDWRADPFLDFLRERFPSSYRGMVSFCPMGPQFVSPFVLHLPVCVFQKAKDFIGFIYRIKESPEYQAKLPDSWLLEKMPPTPSILTSFDFHYNKEEGLKLIEINTNGAFYLVSALQSQVQKGGGMEEALGRLLESFQETFEMESQDAIAILDEEPLNQGLYFEFLIFKEWLEECGYKSSILGLEDYEKTPCRNIYNRCTDFYLEKKSCQKLRQDYWDGRVRLSPNPREYFLMADKRRLPLLREELSGVSQEKADMIPKSFLFSEFSSKEELWSQRKKFFFKPCQSFGSKSVYSGKGISRKMFESIYSPHMLAQERVSPGEQTFIYPGPWRQGGPVGEGGQEVSMKWDLRFFTFQGEVQSCTARLYRGQTTNMRTPLGGLAPVEFVF